MLTTPLLQIEWESNSSFEILVVVYLTERLLSFPFYVCSPLSTTLNDTPSMVYYVSIFQTFGELNILNI